MAKPQYIIELTEKIGEQSEEIEHLKKASIESKKNQSDMMKKQDGISIQIGEMHIALIGTKYDQASTNGQGGGLVKRLGRVEKIAECMKLWKVRTRMRDKTIWIVFSAFLGGVWTVVLLNWQTIFNK